MLDNLTDNLSVLDVTPDLLWQGVLRVIVLGRQVDVDTRALAGEDFSVLAVLAEVDGCAVDLVEEDRGQGANDLERKVGALDHVDRRHKRIDDDGCARRVVDGDGVCFAVDADGGVFAAGDEDGVVDLSVELDNLAWVVEVVLEKMSV